MIIIAPSLNVIVHHCLYSSVLKIGNIIWPYKYSQMVSKVHPAWWPRSHSLRKQETVVHCKGNVAFLLFKDEVFRLQLHQIDVHILVLTPMTVITLLCQLRTIKPFLHNVYKQLCLETDYSIVKLYKMFTDFYMEVIVYYLIFVQLDAKRSKDIQDWNFNTEICIYSVVLVLLLRIINGVV